MAIDMDVEIDNLTVILLMVLAVLALYHRFFGYAPDVPPLLLGRQAELSPVRQPGETAVYRSWATGHGTPLQVRPSGAVKTVGDTLNVPPPRPLNKPVPPITQRYILDTPLTNEALTEIVRLVPLGLKALFSEQMGTVDSPKSIVTLLPPSPSTSLPLLLLSLASQKSNPLVVLPSRSLLPAALESKDHPAPGLLVLHESALTDAVDLDFQDLNGAGILLVGDPNRRRAGPVADAIRHGVNVKWWEEIWDAAEGVDAPETEKKDDTATTYSDIHSYFYELPASGASSSQVVQVTHMNMTSGIAGLLSAFPADKRPTAADVVGSTVRIDSPFGMTIAVASVWTGAGFRLIGPAAGRFDAACDPADELAALAAEGGDQPLPSVLFLSAAHHYALVTRLHDGFLAHPFASMAARHRLRSLQQGHVERGGIMEKLVWNNIRKDAIGGIAGDALRAVIVVGDAPSPQTVALSHALLSLPLTRLHSTFLSAGPVFVSHFYDLQGPLPDIFSKSFDPSNSHSGPPASNIEVVLRGPETEPVQDDEGKPYQGRVWVRGPGVLEPVGVTLVEGWVDTGDNAAVGTNGTFVIESLTMKS